MCTTCPHVADELADSTHPYLDRPLIGTLSLTENVTRGRPYFSCRLQVIFVDTANDHHAWRAVAAI